MTATVEAPTRKVAARVGIIGTGGIGRAHALAVAGLEGSCLTAVADVDPDAAATVGAEHGAQVLPIAELADPDRFDLVVVASPPSTHVEVVEPLLTAGVPVMCEKPIAIDLASARRLAALAASTGTPLTMATKFRFVDDVVQTRSMIEAGMLGDVLRVDVAFSGRVDMTGRWNVRPEVSGGGVLIDNGTHGVDLVRYVVGDIAEVNVVNGPTGQPVDVEDSATLLARTAGGVLAQVDVTWSFRRLSPVYCSVFGTRGSVEIGWGGARAVTPAVAEGFEFGSGYRKIDCLRDNITAVLAALGSGAPLPVSTADAVASAAVIEAGYASAARGSWVGVAAS